MNVAVGASGRSDRAQAADLVREVLAPGGMYFRSASGALMLAYVGASLPLFLLLMLYQEPLNMALNRELLAEEIVRTLVGSLGLMLAVPATSLIASWMASGWLAERLPHLGRRFLAGRAAETPAGEEPA